MTMLPLSSPRSKRHWAGDSGVSFTSAYSSISSLPAPAPITLSSSSSDRASSTVYSEFLSAFPAYRLTWTLDTLRRTDYDRLADAGETFVDYMGGAIYPESLLRVHIDFLSRGVFGNTHSVSNRYVISSGLACSIQSTTLNSGCTRAAVLSFFDASPEEYTVVFTPNASGALKLVGESYPFTPDSTYILACDSHNSVHGIREFARRKGADVCYIPSTATGGFDVDVARELLAQHQPTIPDQAPSLFVMTAQSNISNAKNPMSVVQEAAGLGYHTVLDAAALAATSTISLRETPVDAMAISFYKMFGFPTGIGALVARKSFLRRLERPWFAGGNVDVVQVPGTIVTRSPKIHEQFEDGTINYLSMISVTEGLQFLSAYMPFLPLRLSSLISYLVASLTALRHDITDTPVVRILSATPSGQLKHVGEQSDVGSIVSLAILTPSGTKLPNSFVEHAASQMCISLRTGWMCNPGGAAAISGEAQAMGLLYPGITYDEIDLGLASNFQDVWEVLRFMRLLGHDATRTAWMAAWRASGGHTVGAKP
ncbi:methyltransferase type 11 [Mycena metata]|uniref:Methyltransferase type 11 n=1 Tax=Mycena metata TaxID=1033252 RepID=A0AAD7ISS5_9AGAR|nr:methyltransferase type 11 [Mycena metata]